MSTRSNIGYLHNHTGKVMASYCHSCGQSVGKILVDHYNTDELAKSVCASGYLYSLHESLEDSIKEVNEIDARNESRLNEYRSKNRYYSPPPEFNSNRNRRAKIYDSVLDYVIHNECGCDRIFGIEYFYLYRNGNWEVFTVDDFEVIEKEYQAFLDSLNNRIRPITG